MNCISGPTAAAARITKHRLANFFGTNADNVQEAMMDPAAATAAFTAPPTHPWAGKLLRKRRARRFVQERKLKNDSEERSGTVIYNQGRYFRCDIHAKSGEDYQIAEAECKAMVLKAGGKIMEEFEYIGGFLYDMQTLENRNPLEDGDETGSGGHVHISPWSRSQQPQYNPMRMHPPGGITDRIVESKEDAEYEQRKYRGTLSVQFDSWMKEIRDVGMDR